MTRAEASPRGLMDRLRGFRGRVRRSRVGRAAWRSVITVVGVALVAVGIVLLALPGPGWLIIFAGLGVLATEFDWAQRLLRYARTQVSRWTEWVQRQRRPVQALIGLVSLAFLAGLFALTLWIYAG